jgi:hypothetical protein
LLLPLLLPTPVLLAPSAALPLVPRRRWASGLKAAATCTWVRVLLLTAVRQM